MKIAMIVAAVVLLIWLGGLTYGEFRLFAVIRKGRARIAMGLAPFEALSRKDRAWARDQKATREGGPR